MKSLTAFSCLLALAVSFGAAGCKKTEQVDATQPLAESFQETPPEVQQAIESVNTSLRARDYSAATRALVPIVERRHLSPQQRQAVGTALHQINQAVAADPSLDTKEMYELRAKMFQAVHGGPRF